MSENSVKVLVFSDDVDKRRAVIEGVGTKPGALLPEIEWLEVATAQGVVDAMENGEFALLVIDGEAQKEGGPSVARKLEGLHEDMPPIIMLVARQQDEWIASWAGAAKTVPLPVDPISIQDAVRDVLSGRK